MSFRKEKKFRVSVYDSLILKAQLLDKGMNRLFPKRSIHSQYFDTKQNKMFHDSEEGILPRKKVRVRWYNNSQKILTLENKTSSIEGRFKTTKKISHEEFYEYKVNGLLDSLYGHIAPSVLVEYSREYYQYQDVRITFDSNIRYFMIKDNRLSTEDERVIEIKVPFSVSDDYLEKLLPIPTSRFSKYSRAFLKNYKQM